MFAKAAPHTLVFALFPFFLYALQNGGAWIAVSIFASMFFAAFVDEVVPHNEENLDPNTQDAQLIWFKLVPWLWVPVQLCAIFALLYTIGFSDHLTGLEIFALTVNLGILTGGIGITYGHELLHQKSRFERTLGEVLMCSTLYGHFCIEHVFGHHINVATPKDPASARKNETIYAFLWRSITMSFVSAWKIQRDQLTRRELPVWSTQNAFWRYGAWTIVWFALAYSIAGWLGIAVFILQAFVAVCLLETVNYIEHYGLQRQKLANGKYEPVKPHHSWNANHRLSNYLLINLQRHSDHHYKPARRFALLQAYSEDEAPQLPHSYPFLVVASYLPPLWFSVMNPKVQAWQEKFYAGA